MDDRPLRKDNEINPDVLGYIFEKYVNQKQMGAYYTKEDITNYISRNTVIPFLFGQAEKSCPIAFTSDGGVWKLLATDPDRYFRKAVLHGITYDIYEDRSLEEKRELPRKISVGLNNIAKRNDWDEPAPSKFGLPNETWREHIVRRQRYEETYAKLASNEIKNINDLITYNLDIEKFTHDVIFGSEGPELIRAFWKGLNSISILDPTCGSGAFLFAALNILEPIYMACLEAMREFLDDLKRSKREPRSRKMNDFRRVLGQVSEHANEQYFILKSIVVHNLYGVDIMEEAVEICKLRLFLKLVAQLEKEDQVEPLPDIDFNVRAGNTLVGFTTHADIEETLESTLLRQEVLVRINERAKAADRTFQKFRQMQTEKDINIKSITAAKISLREEFSGLRDELDQYLAEDYGADIDDHQAYYQWRASHQPFHWLVEFNGIMAKGGFDVIVGNPPYKEIHTVTEYKIQKLSSTATRNLYAPIMERCLQISHSESRLGLIVPTSSISSKGYKILQDILFRHSGHFSSYNDRPSRLFDNIEHARLSIHLLQHHSSAATLAHWATEPYRWRSVERRYLFDRIAYQQVESNYLVEGSLPKISQPLENSILKKIWKSQTMLGAYVADRNSIHETYSVYYSRKMSNFLQILDFIPTIYDGDGNRRPPTEFKELRFSSAAQAALAFCLLNSSLFRWFTSVFSDLRSLNKREVHSFPINLTEALGGNELLWMGLASKLSDYLRKTSEMRKMRFKHDTLRIQCIIPKHSKPIIDEIDKALAVHYGFDEAEADFIINYDIKYRIN